MRPNRALLHTFLFVVLGAAAGVAAESRVGFCQYVAATDDVSGTVQTFGQLLVHRTCRVTLSETVRDVPIFSIQFAGLHHRQTAPQDPHHAEARAKCIAERLVHAWTLMDHGATLEVGTDDWTSYAVNSSGTSAKHTAIFIRNPIAGEEPLRILTVYPEDVAGYPWIRSDRSMAEYLAAMIQAHYLLFWKNESNLDKYASLRIGKTAEGKVFREIAVKALELARAKGKTQVDQDSIRETLAVVSLAQRETLCRLAVVPPMDWEASSR